MHVCGVAGVARSVEREDVVGEAEGACYILHFPLGVEFRLLT